LAVALISWSVLASASRSQNGRIVFVSDRSGSWQIFTMNPDGGDQVQVTDLAPTDDDLLAPSISPNGQQIAFNYNAGDGPDLFVVNVDGTGLLQITDDHTSLAPRWSPDGRRIIFATISRLDTAVIATIAADGSGKRRTLTTDLWDSIGGVYTPDGQQIVFGSQMGGLVSAVWIMNADGSHQRRLTHAALRAQPWSVSPEGNQILGYSNQNSPPALRNGIFVMNLDGSGRKRLAPQSRFHHDLYPSYSPDGTKITFISDRFSGDITKFTDGTFDILTMNTDGSALTDVAQGAGYCPNDGHCVTPLWGPNPSELDVTESSAAGRTTGDAREAGSAQSSDYLPGDEIFPKIFVGGLCNVDFSTKKLTGGCVGSMGLHCVGRRDPANCPTGQRAIRPAWVQMCVYGHPYVDRARTCRAL
jgi:Tol biopolymer transport system component